MHTDIFITCNHKDIENVKWIMDELGALGFQCWIMSCEGGIEPKDFLKEVDDAISGAKIIFFFFPNASRAMVFKSHTPLSFCKEEYGRFLRFNDDLGNERTENHSNVLDEVAWVDWRIPEQKNKLMRQLKNWIASSSQHVDVRDDENVVMLCDVIKNRTFSGFMVLKARQKIMGVQGDYEQAKYIISHLRSSEYVNDFMDGLPDACQAVEYEAKELELRAGQMEVKAEVAIINFVDDILGSEDAFGSSGGVGAVANIACASTSFFFLPNIIKDAIVNSIHKKDVKRRNARRELKSSSQAMAIEMLLRTHDRCEYVAREVRRRFDSAKQILRRMEYEHRCMCYCMSESSMRSQDEMLQMMVEEESRMRVAEKDLWMRVAEEESLMRIAEDARPETVQLDQVDFSAIIPKTMKAGGYSMIQVVMYEKDFRDEVDALIKAAEEPVHETRSGKVTAPRNAKVRIVLSSPDVNIDDYMEEGEWSGGYRVFGFPVQLPVDFDKHQVLFVATVYIQGVIATKLKFVASCTGKGSLKPQVQRRDVNSAFISYASEDRPWVISIVQGMQKVRPDLDIFLDVAKLRSGEDWESRLYKEIDDRDVLYLCWSRHAKKSKWVGREWRYAFNTKGIEGIEPVPIEPAETCPPPKALSKLHFNDYLQFLARGMTSAHGC